MKQTLEYSHGFEEIYALEKVDPNSIRPMAKVDPEEALVIREKVLIPPELELNLGAHAALLMPSFVLSESIHELGLSKHIEAYLISRGILTIGEARCALHVSLPSQHVQEIVERIKVYTKNRELDHSPYVNYSAWVLGTLAKLPALTRHILLEKQALQTLVSLNPHEKMELRRFSEERSRQLAEEAKCRLNEAAPYSAFMGQLKNVTDVFIKPWIFQRGGLATRLELMERLYGIAEDPLHAEAAIQFFSSLFFDGAFILDKTVAHADLKLYCPEIYFSDLYDLVIDKALSYFYKAEVCYPLDQLMEFLLRELTSEWKEAAPLFLKKALRFSPQFSVWKGDDQKLWIRLKQ